MKQLTVETLTDILVANSLDAACRVSHANYDRCPGCLLEPRFDELVDESKKKEADSIHQAANKAIRYSIRTEVQVQSA